MMNIFQVGQTLLGKTIEQFSELFLQELIAQFQHRKGDYPCQHSSLVQEMKILITFWF